MEADLLQTAIETFAGGFAFTRSFTHPYVPKRVGSMWVLSDSSRQSGNYRRNEWIAHGKTPRFIDRIARKHSGSNFCISVISDGVESEERIRIGFSSLPYRLGSSEAIMVHRLQRIPRAKGTTPFTVTRVRTPKLAESLNKAAGSRQILEEHLGSNFPLRQYAALTDGEVVGWVRSIDVGGTTWCSNLSVRPEYRRKGIGRQLMCAMLRDDRKFGIRLAVLTASKAGAKLYPGIGYERIGTLLFYTPTKQSRSGQ